MLFFAGAELSHLMQPLLDNGVKRILVSFFYIATMRRETAIREFQEKYPDVEWFLDSGAYTYWHKFESDPHLLMPWREYQQRYFDYIESSWPRWSRIAELDLDNTFDDLPQVLIEKWLEEMLERWPKAPITPVWHPGRGEQKWRDYCRDPRIRYLALGSGGGNLGGQRRMVMTAHRYNKLVHGFGMTKVNTDLKTLPFDTIDSSAWLSGQRYGTIYVFKDSKFILVCDRQDRRGKTLRKLYRSHFKKIGLDWQGIEKDNQDAVRKANIIAWKRLSDRLEEVRKRQRRSLLAEGPETLLPVNPTYPWQAPAARNDDAEKKEFDSVDARGHYLSYADGQEKAGNQAHKKANRVAPKSRPRPLGRAG